MDYLYRDPEFSELTARYLAIGKALTQFETLRLDEVQIGHVELPMNGLEINVFYGLKRRWMRTMSGRAREEDARRWSAVEALLHGPPAHSHGVHYWNSNEGVYIHHYDSPFALVETHPHYNGGIKYTPRSVCGIRESITVSNKKLRNRDFLIGMFDKECFPQGFIDQFYRLQK